jgi:hypothetical protein
MLSSIDLCTVSEISPNTLNLWIRQGYIVPSVAGSLGRGNGRRFSLLRSLAIVVAGRLYLSERGMNPSYIPILTGAIEATGEQQLLRDFQMGKCYLNTIYKGEVLLSSKQLDRVNVEDCYRQIQQVQSIVANELSHAIE